MCSRSEDALAEWARSNAHASLKRCADCLSCRSQDEKTSIILSLSQPWKVQIWTRMMDRAISVAGVPIRLTYERWFHIVENHDDVAGYYEDVLTTIENPDVVLRGYRGTLIAVRNYGRRRYLMVVYRQVSAEDGFIITAYFTSKLDRKQVVWRKP